MAAPDALQIFAKICAADFAGDQKLRKVIATIANNSYVAAVRLRRK